MYALVNDRGKQYLMKPGTVVTVDFRPGEPGTEIVFDEVVVLRTDDELKVGNPFVTNARVVAELVETTLGPKLYIGKFKRRKNYRRRFGHRQPYSLLTIKEITC